MAKNHYIVKRKGGGGGIEYICFQSSLILQFLDTIGFNSTNKSCQESRQINNPAPSTASIKIKMMKFVVTTLLIAALPFFAYGQISNFKKVKKFGSTWIQKEQVFYSKELKPFSRKP